MIGYSRKPSPCVTKANCGAVQVPVRSGLPVKVATVDVVGNITPGSILPSVDDLSPPDESGALEACDESLDALAIACEMAEV